MALPTLDSTYAYVLNRYNGQELYAKAETTANRFASLTKLWAMGKVVRDYYPTEASLQALDLTITQALVDNTNADSDVNLNDIWPGDGLVKAALLPSSNISVTTLLYHIGITDLGYTGTVDEVVDDMIAFMNAEATAAGLSSTTYGTVHGAPGAGESFESGTAKEQATVLDYVCDWPFMRTVWADPTPTINIDRGGAATENISSGLSIFGDTGVIGAKSGTGGGRHLSTLWEAPNGNEVIIVTLDAATQGDSETDHRAIITQLPIDYPYLSGPTGTALPAPA